MDGMDVDMVGRVGGAGPGGLAGWRLSRSQGLRQCSPGSQDPRFSGLAPGSQDQCAVGPKCTHSCCWLLSQFNTRTIASPFPSAIAQSGKTTEGQFDFYAQLLLDDFAPVGTSKGNSFGTAAANLKLVATPFKSSAQASGAAVSAAAPSACLLTSWARLHMQPSPPRPAPPCLPAIQGYQAFLAWIKAEVIKGNWVTLGVIDPFGGLPYSHIANVIGVLSNNPATSTAYNGTDILVIEDHGLITIGDNPAVPAGAGGTPGCTPYKWVLLAAAAAAGPGAAMTQNTPPRLSGATCRFGYAFDSLKNALPRDGSRVYRIPLPDSEIKNYAYSVQGVAGEARLALHPQGQEGSARAPPGPRDCLSVLPSPSPDQPAPEAPPHI
jgi:hypothetical protein